jgi:hypothetical protein
MTVAPFKPSNLPRFVPTLRPRKERTVGKYDPTRDGDVHPDTAKQLDPKEFEKSGQAPTDGDDDDNGDDD